MMFAHWMLPDEPLRLPKLAGAIIALGGVTVICARLLGFNGPLAFWGGVAVVVGAASAAFANVLVKARSMQLAPAMLAAWQMIFGIAPLLLLGFAVDGNPARFHWTASSVFCLLYLAVIGSALTFLLLYWLLPRLTVAQLQSISLITPPGAVMLGWLLGGETFPLSSLLGAALVLVGVWMIFRKAPVPEPLIQEGLVSSHVCRDPRSDRGLRVHRPEELVRTTGPSRTAVTGREIVAEDVCARDLMFLEQPADQRCGSGGLRRSK